MTVAIEVTAVSAEVPRQPQRTRVHQNGQRDHRHEDRAKALRFGWHADARPRMVRGQKRVAPESVLQDGRGEQLIGVQCGVAALDLAVIGWASLGGWWCGSIWRFVVVGGL